MYREQGFVIGNAMLGLYVEDSESIAAVIGLQKCSIVWLVSGH